MPIDFGRIAEQFRAPIGAQMQTITRAFERLGRWLATRRKAFEELERSSRAFPVIAFRDEAVMLTVTESQRGALGSGASPPSFGAALVSGGAAFVRGVAQVGTIVQSDLILPRFFGMLRAIVDLIGASVERFNPPTGSMFNIRERTASDVFGLAGLAVGALGSSRIQIRRFHGWVNMARIRWQEAFGRPQPVEAPAQAAPPPTTDSGFDTAGLVGALDMGVQGISGALLLLPILPQTLGPIVRAALLRVKFTVVALLQGVEARLFALRRRVIDLFSTDLLGFLGTAQSFLTAATILALQNLRFYMQFGIEYGRELITRVRSFLRGLTTFLNYWQQLIERIFEVIDGVLNFDLMPFILASLGLPGIIFAAVGDPPEFTIGDFLGLSASLGRAHARAALDLWLTALEGALFLAENTALIGGDTIAMIRRRVGALRDLLHIGLRPMAQFPTFTRPAPYSGAAFPNIYDAFFSSSAAADLRTRLADFQTNAARDVGAILGAGAELLRGAGGAFDRAAGEAARLGSHERYRRLSGDALRLAETAFGDQVAALSQRGAQESANPVAATFERWLINGGFEIVGSAIPLYIAEMRRYWHAVVAEETAAAAPGAPPTSPHILARRARLGVVRVPGVTIRAGGRALDEALATAIATRFRAAVAEAYHTGERVLGNE